MSKRYLAYGLVFDSELAFPELPVAPDDGARPDVVVRVRAVPDSLDTVSGSGVVYHANSTEFLFDLPDVARFYVANGNQIDVQPYPGVGLDEVRVFVLGSGFGALLHQREFLVLHAAAIRTEHGAVLFAGHSGAGKSTLLNELLRRGYPMIVDDVCAVTVADGTPTVVPGYPRTRLWADAATRLEVDTTDLPRTRPSLEKFERQLPDQFWSEPTPFHRLYVLGPHNEDDVTVQLVPKLGAFSTVLRNTYRRKFVQGLELLEPHFVAVSSVVSSVDVLFVLRPSGSFKLTELADVIEGDLAGTVERITEADDTAGGGS